MHGCQWQRGGGLGLRTSRAATSSLCGGHTRQGKGALSLVGGTWSLPLHCLLSSSGGGDLFVVVCVVNLKLKQSDTRLNPGYNQTWRNYRGLGDRGIRWHYRSSLKRTSYYPGSLRRQARPKNRRRAALWPGCFWLDRDFVT